jgi:3-oxoacyl-[acyl-carrier protein] reductase
VKGRTALVTGGSRGIGRAVVKALEARGARVIAPPRSELDLLRPGQVEAYLGALRAPIDILVNNAGINPLGTALDANDEDIEQAIQVNLLAPMSLARGVAPGMVERGWGRIVNVSSIFGTVTKPGRFAYTVAKTGMNGLTRSLAVELGPRGVLVNSVSPGFVATELTYQNNSPEALAQVAAELPLRRLADPSEIAELIAFLASSANTFVTGQVILADGGYSCL